MSIGRQDNVYRIAIFYAEFVDWVEHDGRERSCPALKISHLPGTSQKGGVGFRELRPGCGPGAESASLCPAAEMPDWMFCLEKFSFADTAPGVPVLIPL
jgi:hypothetical protein